MAGRSTRSLEGCQAVLREIELVIGETYFSTFYADPERLNPVYRTLVYLGPNVSESEPWHMFQFAESFHSDGNWTQMSPEERAEFEEPPVVSYQAAHINPIVDAEGMIAELAKWHSRIK